MFSIKVVHAEQKNTFKSLKTSVRTSPSLDLAHRNYYLEWWKRKSNNYWSFGFALCTFLSVLPNIFKKSFSILFCTNYGAKIVFFFLEKTWFYEWKVVIFFPASLGDRLQRFFSLSDQNRSLSSCMLLETRIIGPDDDP